MLDPRPFASQSSAGRGTIVDAHAPSERCARCEGRGTCRSCAQRRKHAWRLTAGCGLTCEEAAGRMRLTPGQVRLLVSYQDLKLYTLNTLPAERVRAVVEQELERSSRLMCAELEQYA